MLISVQRMPRSGRRSCRLCATTTLGWRLHCRRVQATLTSGTDSLRCTRTRTRDCGLRLAVLYIRTETLIAKNVGGLINLVAAGCRFGLAVILWSRSSSYFMPGPVSASMGDHLWKGKPPWCRTSHPGLLSLSHPSVVRQNEYPVKAREVNRHITRYTSLSVGLVSGWRTSLTWEAVAL